MLSIGEIVDRYEVEAVLGQGAFATVYQVRHIQLESRAALKVLTVDGATEAKRLLQEGRLQAKMTHPNIVTVRDVLEVGGKPALLMDLVKGPSLKQLLERQQPTVEQTVEIFRSIVSAVSHAHEHGIVHRDLKPANVLIDTSSGEPVPIVTDFGIAKHLALDTSTLQTQAGWVMGTPAYMAPEQLMASPGLDERVDMFALGVILYEMTCGQIPFEANSLLQLHKKIQTGNYLAPRSLAPELPESLDYSIRSCLQPDPDQRVPDGETLLKLMDGEVFQTSRQGKMDTMNTMDTWMGAAEPEAEEPEPATPPAKVEPPPDPEPSTPDLTVRPWTDSADPASTVETAPTLPPRMPDETPSAEVDAALPARNARWPFALLAASMVAFAVFLMSPATPKAEGLRLLSPDALPIHHELFASATENVLRGELAVAERELHALMQAQPDEPGTHLLMAILWCLNQKQEATVSSFEQASKLASNGDLPTQRAARLAHESIRSTEVYLTLREEWGALLDPSADPVFETLHSMMETTGAGRGLIDIDEVLALQQARIDAHPTHVVLYILQASLLTLSGQADQALALIEGGLERNPSSLILLQNKAGVLLQNGHTEAAIETYRQILNIDPSETIARRALAIALLSHGDLEGFEREVDLLFGPGTPEEDQIVASKYLAIVLIERGQAQRAEALWSLCFELATRQMNLGSALTCSVTASKYARNLDRLDRLEHWIEQARTVLVQPELSSDLRSWGNTQTLLHELILHSRRGEKDAARALLQRLDALDDEHFKLESRPWVEHVALLEIAAAVGTAAELEDAHQKLRQLGDAQQVFLCPTLWLNARASRALGDSIAESKALEALTDNPCPKPLLKSLSDARLARLRFDQGDLDGAREAVAAFEERWGVADADLKPVEDVAWLAGQLQEL